MVHSDSPGTTAAVVVVRESFGSTATTPAFPALALRRPISQHPDPSLAALAAFTEDEPMEIRTMQAGENDTVVATVTCGPQLPHA
jgi:hypothetical protein